MSDISDILKLAEAINKKASDDKDFKDLLGEVSAALADILEAMKKPEESKRDEQAEADAMGKAIGAALADALKSMKPPSITLPAPAASATSDWKTLRVTPVRNGMGNATSYDIEKIK